MAMFIVDRESGQQEPGEPPAFPASRQGAGGDVLADFVADVLAFLAAFFVGPTFLATFFALRTFFTAGFVNGTK